MNANDELMHALRTLLASTDSAATEVRDEAAEIAAAVSRSSPGAAESWAAAFDRPASEFGIAAESGARATRRATRVLARLVARSQAEGERYARAQAELAIAAASLGELTISALGTATVLGNTQLIAAGVEPPSPATIHRALEPGGLPSGDPAVATAESAEQPAPEPEPEAPRKTLEELLAELDALVGLEAIKPRSDTRPRCFASKGCGPRPGSRLLT
jgi:hypothetical protein